MGGTGGGIRVLGIIPGLLEKPTREDWPEGSHKRAGHGGVGEKKRKNGGKHKPRCREVGGGSERSDDFY